MATKQFKDLPTAAKQPSLADLQAQLAAAQAALKSSGKDPNIALGVAAPAATQKPDTKPEDVPVVIATGAGAPIDTASIPSAQAPAPMAQAPTGAALSSPGDFMALMMGGAATQADSMNALLAAAETDGSGGKLLFPMLTQAPGTSGGPFQRVNSKNPEFNALDLPEGRKAFPAIFIGYRFLGTCWPKGYDANATQTKPAAPLWNAAVPSSNGDAAAELMLAGKAFQFSKRRADFDVDNGGPGIVRPAIEMLLFDPDIGLFVLRTCGHYNSAKDCREQLIACAVQEANGAVLKPFVGEFSPETTRVSRATGQAIVHHWPKITKLDPKDSRAVTVITAYQQFIQGASPEVRKSVAEWFAGDDAPLTNIAEKAMKQAAAM